jgi:hypothetical protein
MIQECPDFKQLDPADILERLNTHEFQLSEKRDTYGPSYGRSRALKAKAVSSSEDSDCCSDSAEDIGRELAKLVEKFQKFTKKNHFGKSSKYDSQKDEASTRDYKKRTCHKCKRSCHYIADCPQWEKESKKKKSKDYDSDDKKKKKKQSKSSSKSSSRKSSYSSKARAFVGKEMDSEEESDTEEVVEESEEESDSGMASLALASAFIAKSIFNTEENDHVTATMGDDPAPAYCFMARGAKVTSRATYFETSSEDDSECESKPSYKTLAKIATEQQTAMEKIQKLLDKSDDLLDKEVNRSQSLIEDIKNLQVKYDELLGRLDTLSSDHEKLSYEYLQRKQELEKLRASHDDL